MLQMHIFNLGCVNTHDNNSKDVRPWSMNAIFQAVFQNDVNNSQTCGMSFTSVPVAAISDTATAKATALTKTGMSFSGQTT